MMDGQDEPSICKSVEVPPLESQLEAKEEQELQEPEGHSPLPPVESSLPMTSCEDTVPPSFSPEGASHHAVPDLDGMGLVSGHLETFARGERLVDKCLVRKRPRPVDTENHDGDTSVEKQSIARWKDEWVAQLIHARGGMHQSFSSPQKRRRVDLWQEVRNALVRTCAGFEKDTEACRKKWRRVYKEYRDDRKLRSSGFGGSPKCRFYSLIDFYMGDALVNGGACNGATSPDDSEGLMKPPAPSAPIPVKDAVPFIKEAVNLVAESLANSAPDEVGKSGMFDSQRICGGAENEKPCTKESQHPTERTLPLPSVHSMLSELVSIGKEMLQITRDSEKEKLALLHSLRDTLSEIASKIHV